MMTHRRLSLRLRTAILIALMTSILVAGAVYAHPASEGSHPGGCIVTVEPGSVPVGGQFTVAGNFGGASIFLVKGTNASPAENAQPNATTPAGSSFSVTFTAEAADIGEWTVWGMIFGSECGDSDRLTVTALPDTALSQPSAVVTIGFMVLVLGVALGAYRLASARRHVSL